MLIFQAVVYEQEPSRCIQPDEALFARIAAGEKSAFCTLYEQCSASVYAFALSISAEPRGRRRCHAGDLSEDSRCSASV